VSFLDALLDGRFHVLSAVCWALSEGVEVLEHGYVLLGPKGFDLAALSVDAERGWKVVVVGLNRLVPCVTDGFKFYGGHKHS
jgi:hypothetical protein